MAHEKFSLEQLKGDIDSVIADLFAESDVGCALIGAAYIEKLLGVMLRSVLIHHDKISESIFDPRGILETSGAQNDIALLIGCISLQAHANIKKINTIRNDFAHSHLKLSFKTNKISNRCSTLEFPAIGKASVQESLKGKPRMIFVTAVMFVAAQINASIHMKKRIEFDAGIEKWYQELWKSIVKTLPQSLNLT